MKVKKHSGELVDFDINRLQGSLYKSGASSEDVQDVLHTIKPNLHEGMHTKDIYKLAFRSLKKKSHSFAARYSLKRALRELGPAGYCFEKWIARLFEHSGYKTVTSLRLQGNSVSHEIDVVAQQNDELLLVECKFRNTKDAKISVTTPMYFLSRIKDMQGCRFDFFGKTLSFSTGWLVTNAHWTKDAINFANHYGVNLLSWDYPSDTCIKRRVDNAGLYPITCLTTLLKSEKETLLAQGCLLVKDILNNLPSLDVLRISSAKRKNIINEAEALVQEIPVNH